MGKLEVKAAFLALNVGLTGNFRIQYIHSGQRRSAVLGKNRDAHKRTS